MNKDITLTPYRRHLRRCQYFGPEGREVRLSMCNCPFHVDGVHRGRRVRASLRTSNRQIAERKTADLVRKLEGNYFANLERGTDSAPGSTIPNICNAIESFLGSYGNIDKTGRSQGDLKYSSWRKYRNSLNHLAEFCKKKGIESLSQIDLILLERYHKERTIAQRTWKTELQTFRTFFSYCVRNLWIDKNCAAEMKSPRKLIPNDVVPYTAEDEIKILTACAQIGGGRYIRKNAVYERLRAKAMILVLRHTAFRVSDVVTLRKDAISWDPASRNWRVRIRTTKTGEPVHLPIPQSLKDALDALPLPRNAPMNCPYYFWNGVSTPRSVVGIAERSLSAVFKRSGVQKAHAHRYRHTLATKLLGGGATYELVADILGNTPEVVRKHYGKWSKGRQDNIDRVMIAHYFSLPDTKTVTNKSHAEIEPVN